MSSPAPARAHTQNCGEYIAKYITSIYRITSVLSAESLPANVPFILNSRIFHKIPNFKMRTFIGGLAVAVVHGLGCLNESGDPVDWFAVLKFHGGVDYAYVDATSENATGPMKLTGKSINSTDSAVGGTLQQLFAGGNSLGYLAFNDEETGEDGFAPSGNATSNTNGHTKGVLAGDANDSGFYLVHSVPKFPDMSGGAYAYPKSGETYGQSFLCISLTTAGVEAAAAQIAYNDPSIISSSLPDGLQPSYPAMASLIAGKRSAGASVVTIPSSGGHNFTLFAKSGSWGLDVYEDLVQPALGVDFYWETWRRSPQMASYCRPAYMFDSINVATLQFTSADGSAAPFKYTQDHSKWGVAVNATGFQDEWSCIGDINRMTSQWARGGGTVCLRDAPQLYNRLVASVASVDGC